MAKTHSEFPPSREEMIESYRRWIADARGLSIVTQDARSGLARRFLSFLDARRRPLADATPVDVDAYFAENAGHLTR